MKINFPATGDVLYAAGGGRKTHFVAAPLSATFVALDGIPALGQPYELKDQEGTTLTYRPTAIRQEDSSGLIIGSGELLAIAYGQQNVIPVAEHDEKIGAAIDAAFEAGRQFERNLVNVEIEAEEETRSTTFDEPVDIYVTFADGTRLGVPGAIGVYENEEVLGVVSADGVIVSMHPSWRSFEVIEPEAGQSEEASPEATSDHVAPIKGVLETCDCGACSAAKAEADSSWPPRFGPIGGNL